MEELILIVVVLFLPFFAMMIDDLAKGEKKKWQVKLSLEEKD